MSKQDNRFNLQINLTKAYKDEHGTAFIEGVASGPKVDLTGERMSPEALKSMVASIEKHIIELRDAHKDEWNDDLGEVISLTLTDDYELLYKAQLDLRLSKAQDLWYRMTEKGKKYGVSIGGKVIRAGMEWFADLGREIYTYFDVELFEISITRQAAYQHSYAAVVTKSMKGISMPENVKKTDDEQIETVETVEAPAEVTEAPAEAQEPVAETPATEEQTEEAQPEQPTEETPTEEPVAAEEPSDATDPQEDEPVEKTEGEEEAAADEADADESEPEAPAEQPAEGEEADEDVEKSTLFSEGAAASATVRNLTEMLTEHIWGAVTTWEEDKRTVQERKDFVAQVLAEYSNLVQAVANTLIDEGVTAEAKKTIVIESAEDVTKSLDAKAQEVADLQKTLSDSQSELEEKAGLLETTQKELEDATEKLEELETKEETRKARAFEGFDVEKSTPHNATPKWVQELL